MESNKSNSTSSDSLQTNKRKQTTTSTSSKSTKASLKPATKKIKAKNWDWHEVYELIKAVELFWHLRSEKWKEILEHLHNGKHIRTDDDSDFLKRKWTAISKLKEKDWLPSVINESKISKSTKVNQLSARKMEEERVGRTTKEQELAKAIINRLLQKEDLKSTDEQKDATPDNVKVDMNAKGDNKKDERSAKNKWIKDQAEDEFKYRSEVLKNIQNLIPAMQISLLLQYQQLHLHRQFLASNGIVLPENPMQQQIEEYLQQKIQEICISPDVSKQ